LPNNILLGNKKLPDALDETKTPGSYFGGSLITLLRWHQVATSTQLSKLWKQIANAPKVQHRQVVQCAVNKTLETLDYSRIRFLLSAVVAKKVVGLEWKVYNNDDLSSGLHPFSIGYVSIEEAE